MYPLALLSLVAVQTSTFALLPPTNSTDTGSADAVNATGHVVGQSDGIAALWLDPTAVPTLLGTLGGPTSHAFAISAAGDVAGAADTDVTNVTVAFRRLTTDTTLEALTPLVAGDDAEGKGINDLADVVGRSATTPVVWPAGSLLAVALAVPVGGTGEANAINDLGVVVGVASAGGPLVASAWIFDGAAGTSVSVSAPAAGASTAYAINDADVIAGSFVAAGGVLTPVLWQPTLDANGKVTSFADVALPLPSGFTQGEALGIDEVGDVAGYAKDATGLEQAVLWHEDTGVFTPIVLEPIGLAARSLAVRNGLVVTGFMAAANGTTTQPSQWQVTIPGAIAVGHDDVVNHHFGAADPLSLTVPDTEGVLANDFAPGAPLAVSDTTLELTTNGTILFDAQGGFAYTPTSGSPVGDDHITYHATDGTTAVTSVLTIHITEALPVVVANAAAAYHPTALVPTYDSSATAVTLLDPAFVSDADGDPLSIVEAGGTAVVTANGSASINGDGTFTYTPAVIGYVGDDTLAVHVTDGVGAPHELDFKLTLADRPPVTADDEAKAILLHGANATLNVLANDLDPEGDPLSAVPANVVTAHGSAVVSADGTVAWVGTGFTGDESFTVVVTDGWLVSTSKVTIHGAKGAVALTPVGGGSGPGCACTQGDPKSSLGLAALLVLASLTRLRAPRGSRGPRSARPSP